MEYGEPEIGARHLILCREVLWNAGAPDAPYTLRNVVHRVRLASGYPGVAPGPFYLYAEYYGEQGEFDVWIDLVRMTTDEDGDEVDEVEETCNGPYTLALHPDRFVQVGRMCCIRSR